MSGGKYPTGGMSPQGTTTLVYVNFAEVDKEDTKVLCPAICQCRATPGIGKKGQSLKQMCVSKHLRERDKELGHQSHYKPEINYDMTKIPPAPIMDKEVKTKGHDWLPGWINKRWDDDPDHPDWKPETGLVRRPDVIIVKDPAKPPTQDNIKQVVEIKFADDVWGAGQERAYRAIAGPDKLAELTPDRCKCPEPKPEPEQPSDKESQEKGFIDYLMDFVDAAEEADRSGGGRSRTRPKRLPRK